MLALRENPESQSSDRDKARFFSLALRICNTPSAVCAHRQGGVSQKLRFNRARESRVSCSKRNQDKPHPVIR
jgi:hypothetical protein